MQMDEIELRGLVFFGRHGVNPEETELGQRFSVDLTVWLDLSNAAESDDLNDTVSYSALYKLVRAEVEGAPSKLIEHVAGRILAKVLDHDSRISKARVAVGKVSPPLKGSTTGEVYVRLERGRA
ncbi:MAG TPA: dihydroneopterin aldolase [Chloroflexia bacterium]|nr:dihydroneopterin aldolase [Chloroflexia bacterium]